MTPLEARFCTECQLDPTQVGGGLLSDDPVIERRSPVRIAGAGFDDRRPVLAQLEALEITEPARFANAVIKLANAYALAKSAGIAQVVHPGFEFLPDDCQVGPVRFVTRCGAGARVLQNNFYYTPPLAPLYARCMPLRRAVDALGACMTLPCGDRAPPPADDAHLFIHLRAGDVFGEGVVHPLYAQPPLAFYQRVLAARPWSRVTLVREDDRNPITAPLIGTLQAMGIPLHQQRGTLREDLETLLTARHLVIARGTFIYPLLIWSRALQQVYAFDSFSASEWCFFPAEQYIALRERDGDGLPADAAFQVRVLRDRTGRYREQVLRRWQNSPAQRQMMLDYPVTDISG